MVFIYYYYTLFLYLFVYLVSDLVHFIVQSFKIFPFPVILANCVKVIKSIMFNQADFLHFFFYNPPLNASVFALLLLNKSNNNIIIIIIILLLFASQMLAPGCRAH